jgi:hypothetical protein
MTYAVYTILYTVDSKLYLIYTKCMLAGHRARFEN